jgi:hypothetical protein
MPAEERKELVRSVFEQDFERKFAQQEKCISALPLVKITMQAFVEGEDEIVVNDILTCKLRIDYLNLKKGEKSGYVHSKHYPFMKRDNWFLIITDDTMTNLAAVEKLTITDNFYEKEFKERVSRPGSISFTAILMNDSYRGLDQIQKVEVPVLAEAKNRQEIEYLKEDIKAIKQANIIQTALDMAGDETSSDEEEVDEATELRNKLRAAGLKTAIGETDDGDDGDESKKDK